MAASTLSNEEKMKQLQQLYEAEVELYKKTIERMDKYPKIIWITNNMHFSLFNISYYFLYFPVFSFKMFHESPFSPHTYTISIN